MKLFICQFCGRETTNAGANGAHKKSCIKNPFRVKGGSGENQYTKAKRLGLPIPELSSESREKIIIKAKNQRHTQETKNKISAARIKYLSENPDKVPYKLNHYSKGSSYPEKYWKRVFDKFKLEYTEQYQIHTYQLDFALVEEKIDIEIDGDQHYLDKRITKSDKRRDEYLKNLGWKVIRIRWSEYKKLVDKEDRKKYVNFVINQIWTGTQVDKGN